MSNSVFQSVILQLKDVPGRVFGIIDAEGCVISCTEQSYIGERWTDAALRVNNSTEGVVTFGQKCFKAIVDGANFFEYAVFCTGSDETAKIACTMAYIALNDAKIFYEEKHDRGTFGPRNSILLPMPPEQYFWFDRSATPMWLRWMCCPPCSRIRVRILS